MMEITKKLINLANRNKKGYPFSACIKYRGKKYFAVNEITSKNDPTAHAEVQVIRLACKKERKETLKNAKIYCSSEPCPMCLTAIAWSGIKEIYYINPHFMSISNNKYYDKSSKKVNKLLNLNREIKCIGDKNV